MRVPATIRPFHFKNMSKQDMVELLNREAPIDLQYNQELVERVYQRYPFITKAEVAIIIRLTFQAIRDFIVLGKVINLNGVFVDMKLFFINGPHKEKKIPRLRVKLTTPPTLKKQV